MSKPVGLKARRDWIAQRVLALVSTDVEYYNPMLQPGTEGRNEYLSHFGTFGCKKVGSPTELQLWRYLINVVIDQVPVTKLEVHCQRCLPCLMLLGRMLTHYVGDCPGVEWSQEVAKEFPLLVKSWENNIYHFRLHYTSHVNGPSVHVHSLPFKKEKIPLLSASCAGIFASSDTDKVISQLATKYHKGQLSLAKSNKVPAPKLDPVLIVQFSRELSFDIDREIFDFLDAAKG